MIQKQKLFGVKSIFLMKTGFFVLVFDVKKSVEKYNNIMRKRGASNTLVFAFQLCFIYIPWV